MVAAPGCWQAWGELQADEVSRFGYPPAHGLAVDAYAATHGGDGTQRRDRQSVCLHLMAICLVVEREPGPRDRLRLLQTAKATKVEWPALARPPGTPELSHQHAAGAADLEDYASRVLEWARAVWSFWAPEHRRVRSMLDSARSR